MATGLTGCSDSGKETTTAQQKMSKAVAEALTTGVEFKRGLLKRGGIPKASADDVDVKDNDEPLELAPGDAALMSLDVDNPDEDDDPVVATLIQFDGSDDHVEVEVGADADAGASDDGHIETSFELDDDICKDFCNKKFPIVMFQAIKLKGGKVSKSIERSFNLDCRADGDPDKCEGAKEDIKKTDKADAGAKAEDTDTPVSSTGPSSALSGAMVTFDRASCVTCDSKSQAYCNTAPFSADAVQCVAAAVDDNADDSEVVAWANCVAGGLKSFAQACAQTCDDMSTCSPIVFQAAGLACNELPAAAQGAVDDCMLVPDAGLPTD